MPKTLSVAAKKRATKAPKAKKPAGRAAAPDKPEFRGARRKRETRARLLEAALNLMAEKGMEGVAINEITEAADVGFGSFYYHFESKEAIYAALLDQVFEGFSNALDHLVRGIADPAEVISVSIRHTLLRARREPVWGQFLVREGYSTRAIERGIGQRLLRDIQKGIATKRFVTKDPLMAFIAVAGISLASISAELQIGSGVGPQAAALKGLGLSSGDLAERAAAIVLKTLGLPEADADSVSQRPLPVVEFEG